MVRNTAYGLAGRRVNNGVAALPCNDEEILARAEGGKKGKQGLARVLTSSGSSYGGLIRRGRSAAADPRRRGGSVEVRREIPVRGAG